MSHATKKQTKEQTKQEMLTEKRNEQEKKFNVMFDNISVYKMRKAYTEQGNDINVEDIDKFEAFVIENYTQPEMMMVIYNYDFDICLYKMDGQQKQSLSRMCASLMCKSVRQNI
jgi:hypothetical protein